LQYSQKHGGFLGAILPFLATAGKTLLSTVVPGIIGGMAMAGGTKAVDAIDRKINGQGMPKVMYVKRGNTTLKITRLGSDLYLSPFRKGDGVNGDGVFLKPASGSGYINGRGLISGTSPDNSPVARIPILEQIQSIRDLLKTII